MKKITMRTVNDYQLNSLFKKGGTLLHYPAQAAGKLVEQNPDAEVSKAVQDIIKNK